MASRSPSKPPGPSRPATLEADDRAGSPGPGRRLALALARAIDARWSAAWLILVLLAFYSVAPMVSHLFILRHPNFVQLALLTITACAAIAVGFSIPVLDRRFSAQALRLGVDARFFQLGLWGTFVALFLLALITAPSVPIVSALSGATTTELDVERAQFLKLRTGWQAILPYAHSVVSRSLLPYGLALLFLARSRSRFLGFGIFLFYTEVFLVKALFILVVSPLLYLFTRQRRSGAALALILLSLGLLFLNTTLTRVAELARPERIEQPAAVPDTPSTATIEAVPQGEALPRLEPPPKPPWWRLPKPPMTRADSTQGSLETSFMGARYLPSTRLGFIAWRAFAVPVFTSADALRVFDERHGGEHFFGATSLLLSKLFGLERVPLESHVFAFQWGESPYGRSNYCFLVEAYVNFGWPGVIVFSLLIGQACRWFHLSNDEAFKSLWPLFAFLVSQAGLLGTLFSNGFTLLFLLGLFLSVRPRQTELGERRLLYLTPDRPVESSAPPR